MLIRQKHHKSIICHYWYFLNKGFKFQTDVCNGCHDVLMMPIYIILNICSLDCCIINGISKSEVVNLLQKCCFKQKKKKKKQL